MTNSWSVYFPFSLPERDDQVLAFLNPLDEPFLLHAGEDDPEHLFFDVGFLVQLVKRKYLVLLCHGLQDLNCHSCSLSEFPLRYTNLNIYVNFGVREGEFYHRY